MHPSELGFGRKIAIMCVLISTQLIQMIPFGAGMNGSLNIGHQIGAPESKASWIAASYPMTQGAFVLIGGRLGDVYGHKTILLGGAIWWVIWCLVTGFAKTIVTVSLFRGLAGIGAAFIVPNAVALLTHTFPPGKLRNIAMGSFGAMAPIGAAGGSVLAALFVQLTEWKWLFFFLAMLGTAVFGVVAILVPGVPRSDPDGKVDWVGAYLGVGGLILFNFVWNQAPSVGWQTPYVYILLIVAILHLAMFLIWEAKVASSPILPFNIWKAPSFLLVIVVVFLSVMSFGIFIWYFNMWLFNIRNQTLLATAASVTPLTIGGAVAAFTAAWLIPRLPAQYILAIGSSSMVISSILLATMPEQQIYWRAAFIAVLFSAFCPDFVFTAAQIIASNSVAKNQLGVAASLIGTLFTYGMSTGIGFGGTVEAYTNRQGTDLVRGYRNAMYLGVGLAATAVILSLGFIRIHKDVKEGWDDKDAAPKDQPDMPSTETSSTVLRNDLSGPIYRV